MDRLSRMLAHAQASTPAPAEYNTPISDDAPISPLVARSKIEAQFNREKQLTQQTCHSSRQGYRGVREEQHWQREEQLGCGSFGYVYLEKCTLGSSMGQVRAVKEIRKRKGIDYLRELEAVATFSCPQFQHCFVQSFGWYEDNLEIFILMEYFSLGDLSHHIQNITSPVLEHEAIQILSQILEGVDFMHRMKYAHRDLKPANILVAKSRPDWWVKIADFGISKCAMDEANALRTIAGTPEFLAPEIAGFFAPNSRRNNGSYTLAVDVWSIGMIAFWILTGELPFESQSHLSAYVMGKIRFPSGRILAKSSSHLACDFTENLTVPDPGRRLTVKQALQHAWVRSKIRTQPSVGEQPLSSSEDGPMKPYSPKNEYSACWSTGDAQETSRVSSDLDLRPTTSSHSSEPHPSTPNPEAPGRSSSATEIENRALVYTRSTIIAPISILWSGCVRLHGHRETVWGVTFSPDGRLVASASLDGYIRLWSTATGKVEKILAGDTGAMKGVAFSTNGMQLVSGSKDGKVILWDVATGKRVVMRQCSEQWIRATKFSPDDKLIATASDDGTVKIWDITTGHEVQRFIGHRGPVKDLAYSPDGSSLVSVSDDHTVRVWETASGKALMTLEGHTAPIISVAYSPGGELIASASRDHTVRLWDARTGKSRRLEGHGVDVFSVAFSMDGRLLASGSKNSTIRIWHATSGLFLGELERNDSGSMVIGISFSPDSRLVASTASDCSVMLQEVTNDLASRKLHCFVNFNENKILARLLATSGCDDDNSTITLSRSIMDDLQLFRGDTVLVKSKYERDTVLIVTTNDNASDGCAQINRIVRQNLQMEPGDYITVEPLADIKYAKRIRVLPLADTIQGQTGSLFDDFLRPYFQEAYRPVRAGDFFTCTGAKGTVEFKIVETDPPEYGIVAPDTLIQCESVPIQRESHRGTKHGGPG